MYQKQTLTIFRSKCITYNYFTWGQMLYITEPLQQLGMGHILSAFDFSQGPCLQQFYIRPYICSFFLFWVRTYSFHILHESIFSPEDCITPSKVEGQKQRILRVIKLVKLPQSSIFILSSSFTQKNCLVSFYPPNINKVIFLHSKWSVI